MTEIFNLYAFVCKLRKERLEGRRRKGEDKRIPLIPPVRRTEKAAINCVVPLDYTVLDGAWGSWEGINEEAILLWSRLQYS